MVIQAIAKIGAKAAAFLVYFPEMKLISWALKTRKNRKECERKIDELKEQFSGLDDILADMQNDLASEQPLFWFETWTDVSAVKDEAYSFANYQLNTEDLLESRPIKERKPYVEKRKQAIESISKYTGVAEQTLTELRQDISQLNKKEVNAVHNYIRTLKDFYEKNKHTDITLEDELKLFESKHPTAKITALSRKRRFKDAFNAPKKKVDLTAKAIGYVSSVGSKLSRYPPEYDPRGIYLNEKDKWSLKSKLKEGKTIYVQAENKQHIGWTKSGLRVSCEYIGNSVPTLKDLWKRNKNAERFWNNRYEVVCLVGNEKNEEFAKSLKEFNPSHISVLYYSLDNKELVYCPKDTNAQIFANYFDPSKEPKGIDGILEAEQKKSGNITLDYISKTLRMDDVERKKLGRMIFPVGYQQFVLTRTKLYGGEKK